MRKDFWKCDCNELNDYEAMRKYPEALPMICNKHMVVAVVSAMSLVGSVLIIVN